MGHRWTPIGRPPLLETLRALTPEERLRWNDRAASAVLELRHAFAAAQPDDAARPALRELVLAILEETLLHSGEA